MVEVEFPDTMPAEIIEHHVRQLEGLLQDPDKNAVVVGVPKSWNETQREAFALMVVQLRDEVTELVS